MINFIIESILSAWSSFHWGFPLCDLLRELIYNTHSFSCKVAITWCNTYSLVFLRIGLCLRLEISVACIYRTTCFTNWIWWFLHTLESLFIYLIWSNIRWYDWRLRYVFYRCHDWIRASRITKRISWLQSSILYFHTTYEIGLYFPHLNIHVDWSNSSIQHGTLRIINDGILSLVGLIFFFSDIFFIHNISVWIAINLWEVAHLFNIVSWARDASKFGTISGPISAYSPSNHVLAALWNWDFRMVRHLWEIINNIVLIAFAWGYLSYSASTLGGSLSLCLYLSFS